LQLRGQLLQLLTVCGVARQASSNSVLKLKRQPPAAMVQAVVAEVERSRVADSASGAATFLLAPPV
jgi:hypothetical protein